MFSEGKWCLIIELKHIGNAVDEQRVESTREVNDIDDTCKLRITRRVCRVGVGQSDCMEDAEKHFTLTISSQLTFYPSQMFHHFQLSVYFVYFECSIKNNELRQRILPYDLTTLIHSST